ncbi:glycoside hydrolase family 2 TIM barrel-domain containing protein [Chryseobacterium wanjuense]
MVTRDANHPSIIFWSNGNEGGHNFDLDAEFAKYDVSNRPVIHAHHKPGNAFNGIDCNHYEDYYSTKKFLKEKISICQPSFYTHRMMAAAELLWPIIGNFTGTPKKEREVLSGRLQMKV